jgi:protein-S-isoprenylcysteine O-methyltransferase Ste14
MSTTPLLVFSAVVLAQSLGESLAMWRTGTLRRPHQREWTYYAVAVPYKLMIASSLLEHLQRHTVPSPLMLASGSVLAVTGILIRVACHLELAGAFSPYVERSAGQRLVQSGLYRRVRHPMYVGSILLAVGTPLIVAATLAWLFTAATLVGLLLRIHKEEAFLATEFPEYRAYMEKTSRLVPGVY